MTHRSVVTEDQIDHLGHMNVRFYGINATAGTTGAPRASAVRPSVRASGSSTSTPATTASSCSALGCSCAAASSTSTDDELGLYHELANEETGVLAATFVHRVLLESGRRGTVSRRRSARAGRASSTSRRKVRRAASRSTTDPVANAPSLAALRTRGLAIRKVRAVSPEECDADGSFLPAAAPALVWAGEPIDRALPRAAPRRTERRAHGLGVDGDPHRDPTAAAAR